MRLVLLALLPLAACGSNGDTSTPAMRGEAIAAQPSGAGRSYPVRDFTAVDMAGPDDVEITTGAEYSVRAEGDTAVLDRIEVRRDGDTLRIGRRPEQGVGWGSETVRLFVTMPAVRSVARAGSGDVTLDRAQGDFNASLAGSGDIAIGQLQGGRASLSIAGSGTLSAAGNVDTLAVDIAGSGDVRAEGLRAGGATVSIAGSGTVTADVTGPANVSLMGSGTAALGSGARCDVTKVGSGEARCGN